MSTFEPQAPKAGWEKRWVRQAGQLMLATPHIILVICVIGFACAWLMASSPQYEGVMNIFFGALIGSPLICWAYHAMGKHEGYVQGHFGKWTETWRIMFPNLILMFLAFLFADYVVSVIRSDVPEMSVGQLSKQASDMMVFGFIMAYNGGIFRQLTLAMVGVGRDEDEVLSVKAHKKLLIVFPRVVFFLWMTWLVTGILLSLFNLDVLSLPINIALFYWVYVAGREIIGGIDGNKSTAKSTSLSLTEATS